MSTNTNQENEKNLILILFSKDQRVTVSHTGQRYRVSLEKEKKTETKKA